MDIFWILIVTVFLLVLRLLQVFSIPETPKLFYKKNCTPFIDAVLKSCPIFFNVYKPTLLWGKSGHFQTVIHVKMGRTQPKWPDGQRHRLPMSDGATMSYDLFDPQEVGHRAKFTLALCPGIANSSECIYLRTFASYAQAHGFRVAILNHLGALPSEKLTSPRIYTYGGTTEYGHMIDHLLQQYPETKILAAGFSMGGNIVTKYLGESIENQDKVLCGMSVCQGYEINEAKDLFMQWENCRRVYTYFMTRKQKKILSRHRQLLFGEEAEQKCGKCNETNAFRATSLVAIDENYSCVRLGYSSAYEYYKDHSSAYCLNNIKIPMLFMNSEDDPLVPPALIKYPKEFAENHDHCIFMTTKHGGHLGYFEGGIFVPDNVTWLDRVIIEYADTVSNLYSQGRLPQQLMSRSSPQNSDLDMTCDSGIGMMGNVTSCDLDLTMNESSSLTLRQKSKNESIEERKEEKKGSLKKGSLLKQATSYVQ
ncbi:Monoacylglycerol lipase abhd2 [Mactra antiquata]